MTFAAELVISLLLVIAGVFGLVGSVGLLKLRVAMQRLHAPTNGTTVGVGAALIASAFEGVLVRGVASWQEVLVTIFLFMTAPLTALYLAKAHLHALPDRSILPATGTEANWAGEPDQPS
jgi:multicomponent K+:H+ antiporter subunit G